MKTRIAVAAVVLLGLAQLLPLDRSNPPVVAEVPASPEAREVLRRACYDCHSNETHWPWYAWVAPVSWLVVHDVHEGREHMNFSEWDRYSAEEQAENREEAWHEVEEGEMPLWFYLPLHPEARLGDADRKVLERWSSAP